MVVASIYTAAWNGDLEEVVNEVENGAPINAHNDMGYTPLTAALRGWEQAPSILIEGRNIVAVLPLRPPVKMDGWRRIVEYLLERGADPNLRETNSDRLCPMHLAAKVGREAVELLLKYGADPNCKDRSGVTPLHVAAYYGKVGAFRSLLKAGAYPNAKEVYGRTPLHFAAYRCRWAVVESLRGVEGVNWDATDEEGRTPAMYGAAKCDAKEVLLLATFGDGDLLRRSNNGMNLFHWMIALSDDEDKVLDFIFFVRGEVKGLLEAEIPPCGMNALHLAALRNYPHVFERLLSLGIKDRPVDLHGCFEGLPKGKYTARDIFAKNSIKLEKSKLGEIKISGK